jgi:xanthine/CO dehydrogenase XdhC/CoxF family maturation factor
VPHWQETASILERIVRVAERGGRAALATVVRIEGSAYRRPGAKLLVEETGNTLGSVSGGCLEADVREAAASVIRSGKPRLLHYDTGEDEGPAWGLGLGCGGSVEVFVQPATSDPLLEVARRARTLFEGDEPFAVATVAEGNDAVGGALLVERAGAVVGSTAEAGLEEAITGEALGRLRKGESGLETVGSFRVFVEVQSPPPRLVVCGADDDAIPLVAYAADAGFRVVVVDHRPASLSPERFPAAAGLVLQAPDESAPLPLGASSYVVVKTHSLARDQAWIERLLPTPVPYIGLLGPGKRLGRILGRLRGDTGGRVFGPVGLDLGADGPHQIALSIVAELLAVRSGREPRHLRHKEGAIHAV